MNPKIGKLRREYDDLVEDISPEQMEDIFCKKKYEAGRLLWVLNDQSGYDNSERDILEFLKKMTPNQKNGAVWGWLRADLQLLYDLRCLLRSEQLQFLGVMIAHHHLFGMIDRDLMEYQRTREDVHLESALSLLGELGAAFKDKIGSPEGLELLEKHIKGFEGVEDLTPGDLENIDLIRVYLSQARG
ncbi:MAG TPA: hypothetical protein PKK85_04445 [Methanobacteriaceae archaeon]|nr:hypothetical protein [Methanobacteriaceae archaeon]